MAASYEAGKGFTEAKENAPHNDVHACDFNQVPGGACIYKHKPSAQMMKHKSRSLAWLTHYSPSQRGRHDSAKHASDWCIHKAVCGNSKTFFSTLSGTKRSEVQT